MKKISILIAPFLLALAMVIPASATNYVEYRDQAIQLPTTYATHWAPRKWVDYQWFENSWATIRWKSDSWGDDFIQDAFDGWINAAGRTNRLFAQKVSASDDVYFKVVLNPISYECGSGATVACIEVTSWVNNHQRDSSYWSKATVWVGSDLYDTYTNEPGYDAAMYNLVGQLLGMFEQFDGGVNFYSCNPDEYSIMDGVKTDAYGLKGCDVNTIYSQDLLEIQWLWNGETSSSSLSYIFNGSGYDSGPNRVWFAWRDGFWNETFIEAHFYYYNGSDWIKFTDPSTAVNTGTHDSVEMRSLHFNVYPANHGVPHGVWIQGCAEADMSPTYSNIGWSCGALVWYP